MKKKITLYELLGLIKDGKAPKKIKWGAKILYFDTETNDYLFSEKDEMYTDRFFYGWGCCNEKKSDWLNSYVRILDEEYEFIDIEELDGSIGYINWNSEAVVLTNAINKLIKNQKKIIERINK